MLHGSCCTFVLLLDRVDDHQITHLIDVRLKRLLCDFFGGVLGLLPVVFLYKRPKIPP